MRTELGRRIVQNHPEMMAALGSQRARLAAEMDAEQPDPLAAPIAAVLGRSTARLVEQGLVAAPPEEVEADGTGRATRVAAVEPRPIEGTSPRTMSDDLALMGREDVLAVRAEIDADPSLSPGLRAQLLNQIGRRLVEIDEEDDLILSVKATAHQAPSLTPSEHEPVDELDADYGLGDELVPDPIPWGDDNAMAELSW